MPFRRSLAFITAIAAWAALGLQLGLLIDQMTSAGASVVEAVWRFFGYFTIIMNLMAAVVASALVLNPTGRLAGPRSRLVTAAAIVFGGLVYSVALRAIWQPTGWQAVADHALHDATPVLFFLTWLAWDHGGLRWRDALWAVVPPLGYCAYAFARGAADGWYAYWFLNPEALNLKQLSASIVLLTAAFLIIAVTLIAIDRVLARGRRDVIRPESQSGSRSL
ncbi:Pr6Pr family membrane protein [Aminobacter anthyllidis]|uniref:Pr6Pr family membrane protein n=1 Tax=Aminobacter anthyllidis TaxID=1035067 RepID=UPI0024548CB0|nr:Pr6Pr family membrane protein [Aminobacter anthyllidis]MDH4986485.1 Pr6Pr family membrane protein [Aminobacter anthyllidis]